jgi:branched-chain amino acid transport system permease protein
MTSEGMAGTGSLAWRRALPAATLALALAAAIALPWLANPFYVSFATRVLIYAIAATSLNLVLGYGGMVSFGHAAFLGAGAYVSAICIAEGVTSAWIGWPLAVLAGAALAALIGALSLRTRGVYFIMITLAFAQMMFYLVNSMKAYGGDEGLTLKKRAELGTSVPINLDDTTHLYLLVLALLAATLVALSRLARSRFGRVITAIRENEVRAEAIGFAVQRYKLACFVIGGAVCALAGALLASHGKYVNPNVLHWTQSGTLMVMVILGGVATLWGGLAGAAALLLLQEVLSSYTEHWEFWTGWVLLAVVLFARNGLGGLLQRVLSAR